MKRETFDISKVRSRGLLPVIYSTHHLPHVNIRKSNHYDVGECPHGPGYDKIMFFMGYPLSTFQDSKPELIWNENTRNSKCALET